MKWDPTVHEDILITLFQHVPLTSEHWAKVMDELRVKGYTFSENALRYTLLLFSCFHVVLSCFRAWRSSVQLHLSHLASPTAT